MQLLNTFNYLRQQGIDVYEAFAMASTGLGNLEDFRLCFIKQQLGITSEWIQGIGSDLVSGCDQLA